MRMKDWNTINNLTALIRESDVLYLVKDHYERYMNTAPEACLREALYKVQRLLDENEFKLEETE
jgi:hypothetical protein